MPFDNDTSWPAGLLTTFDIAPRNTIGTISFTSWSNEPYYGPYNKLLAYCFGENFDFVVAPQAPPIDTSKEDLYLADLIVFNVDQQPVLFVELGQSIDIGHSRRKTDAVIRERFNELLRACPIPKLYGLGVHGTQARVYCGDKAQRTVRPPLVATDSKYVIPREYLANEWSVDILSDDGFSQMKEIVQYIKAENAKHV
ncbi:hypothetical protein C8R45DRAFT_522406 [Mycena sanguinolenta]|nr:hypothetical protein C8R45DRAFT_522406 [Mycena sanguinolenta]